MSHFSPIPPDDAPRLDPGHEDQLVLVKKDRRWEFDCPPGRETEVLQQLQQLVADPSVNFNWFDAAVLSHQLGQRMSDRLTLVYQNRRPA